MDLNTIDYITLFVDDLEHSKSFYTDVLALPLVYEDATSDVVQFTNVSINLLVNDAARELVGRALVARSDAGTRVQFTITVDDVDATCAHLAARGVTLLSGPMDRPWGVRTANFADPSGHVWEIAH